MNSRLHVSQNGVIVAAYVNLDAIIPREDFEKKPNKSYRVHTPANSSTLLSFSESLLTEYRKPDFQRETNRWSPKDILDLIQTILRGDLVPAVILWQHGQYHFVMDGAHRLSALLAWVYDDYGDRDRSRALFGDDIPDYQIAAAKKTRSLINEKVGTYAKYVKSKTRKSQLANINIYWQWVPADSTVEQVEASFRRINQQGSRIPPLELKLLTDRTQPQTIAARAIMNAGRGQSQKFSKNELAEISEIASDVNNLLFKPSLPTQIRTLDLPLGGAPTAGPTLPMVWELVTIAVGSGLQKTTPATQTIECLNRVRNMLRMVCSSHPGSFGLHPAVYVYSWRGAHQSRQLIATIKFLQMIDSTGKTSQFSTYRKRFEDFLVKYRSIPAQIIRKFGGKPKTSEYLEHFLADVFEKCCAGKSDDEIIKSMLYKPEEPSSGTPGADFSDAVKNGVALREFLKDGPKCTQCGALMPSWCMSADHGTRKRDGGTNAAKNLSFMHHRCNNSVKN